MNMLNENETEQTKNLKALMDMFVAIKKLNVYYTFDQSVDILDIYFNTNDPKYITTYDDIRNFVVSSQMRDKIFPLVDGKYNHLFDFINELYPANKKEEEHHLNR